MRRARFISSAARQIETYRTQPEYVAHHFPLTHQSMILILLRNALVNHHITQDAHRTLRRSYGILFSCYRETEIREALFALLCGLTERQHVRAFRVRALLALYHQDKSPHIYDLLDTFAMYWPSLLLPVDQAAKPSSSSQKTNRSLAPASSDTLPTPPWHAWVHSLPCWMPPDMVPGLATGMHPIRSRVPRCVQVAALLDHDTNWGVRLAASVGRLLAAHYAYQHRKQKHEPMPDVPPFDPHASAILDALYMHCAPMQELPMPLVPFLAHVIRSMGHDAVVHLKQSMDISGWERTWHPTLLALSRLFTYLPHLPWDVTMFPALIRPLCHMAAMDGVSDMFSAHIMQALTRALSHWCCTNATETHPFLLCVLELQDALLLDGDPSIAMYVATIQLHAVLTKHGRVEASNASFPCPFIQLATPPAMTGSVLTLDLLCAHVLRLRAQVLDASQPLALDARCIDAMATSLVDMIWSGRAFGQFLQQGLVIDHVMACDRGAMAIMKYACDELRIVPFVLIASLSHGALLAPLFEQYCNESLLPGHDIRAPITPSALRSARGAGLPEHIQYVDIRRDYLLWLARRGAPNILALLEAFVPSLRTLAAPHMLQ